MITGPACLGFVASGMRTAGGMSSMKFLVSLIMIFLLVLSLPSVIQS